MLSKHVFRRPRNTLESERSEIFPAVPEDLYLKCAGCEGTFPRDEFLRAMKVCPFCGQLSRLGARERLDSLCDAGSFSELFPDLVSSDPLNFPGYGEKLARAAEESGENEGVICGLGAVEAGNNLLSQQHLQVAWITPLGDVLLEADDLGIRTE